MQMKTDFSCSVCSIVFTVYKLPDYDFMCPRCGAWRGGYAIGGDMDKDGEILVENELKEIRIKNERLGLMWSSDKDSRVWEEE